MLIPVKTYAVGFTVRRDVFEGERTYGPVRRGGRVHWRNYHRRIPNGRSCLELFAEKTREAMDRLATLAPLMCGRRP